MFTRVEHLIAEYMKAYEANYTEAIEMMTTDLEAAKSNKELKEDTESDAKKV